MDSTDHPHGSGVGNPPGTSPGYAAVSETDRGWATVAHAGSFVAAWLALGAVAPLLVLLLKGNSSPYVRQHALESLQFQLNMLFWIVVSVVLFFVLIGFFLIAVVGLWYTALVIIASVQAHRGRSFRYPAIVRFLS